MKAVALTRYLPIDDPQSLLDVELPQPSPPTGHDLLVRVEAVSVNPVDTKVRSPKPQVEAQPKVLGYDAAGVVEAVGDEVTLFKPGDAVYYAGDITRPGSNAAYQLVDERLVGSKPHSLDFAQAAALPLTAITAWELLFQRMPFDADNGGKGKIAAGHRRRRRRRFDRDPARAPRRFHRDRHRIARGNRSTGARRWARIT